MKASRLAKTSSTLRIEKVLTRDSFERLNRAVSRLRDANGSALTNERF